MKDITVLITCACEMTAPGTISCLKNNGERRIKVIGVDLNPDHSMDGMLDEIIKVSRVSDERYVDELLKICNEFDVDVLLPGISDELILLANRKKEFEEIGTKIPLSNIEALEICTNKYKFYEFMKNNEILKTDFYIVNNVEEYDNAASALGFPQNAFVLKATVSSGSRGVRIIDPKKSRSDILFYEKPSSLYTSFEDLRSILVESGEFPEMMAMQYLSGEEYSVDVLADNGKVRYICGRESNVVNASIPMEATLREDKDAYRICEKCVEKLGLHGNIDFDFKYNDSGEAILMEINPRRAATMSVFMEGGLNLIYLCIKQELGEELPKTTEIRYGTKMKRRYLEQFSFAGE